jgi:hypothetical protein
MTPIDPIDRARCAAPARIGRSLLMGLLMGLLGPGLGAGCAGQECGPGEAPAAGVNALLAGQSISYGGFTSSPNNDCSVPGAPTSLTLDGVQTDPAPSRTLHLTFCLPRPDRLGSGPVALDDTERVEVIDIFGELDDGCLFLLDRDVPPTGTIDFQGYCDQGLDAAGYAVVLDGTVAATNMCTGERVTVELGGSAAVQALDF